MTIQAKPIKRIYTMEDELMLTRAQTMHDNLAADVADFQAKFPWLDVAFIASFLTDITTAASYPLDGAVVNNIKVLTEDVAASMVEGMKALDTLDVYARVAYRDSLARQRVFGQNNWDKARNDQQKMVDALELAYGFASVVPYNTDLQAKGMSVADIDSLNTISQNIALKNKLQEFAKSGRPISTEDRIKVYNIVWERQQLISICSELVYRDDAAKRAQYLLYPQTSEPGFAVREADVPAGATLNINMDGVQPTATSMVTTIVIDNPLKFFASATEGGEPIDVIYELPIGSATVSIDEYQLFTGFDPSVNFLTVRNTGGVTAHYKITVTNVIE